MRASFGLLSFAGNHGPTEAAKAARGIGVR